MDSNVPSKHRHHHYHRQRSFSSPGLFRECQDGTDQERIDYIIDTFEKNFGDEMRENPKGWRGRFRKMAANPFAFYRGSAVLFYRDMAQDCQHDPWLRNCKDASHMFIHGDLHAENFGTYIDRYGDINFDVNDFDEGYIGPFTWDIKRLIASMNIVTFSKAFGDERIMKILRCLLRSYISQVQEYCDAPNRHHVGLTSANTRGPVNILLKESRLGSKESHLDTVTKVENYERKFIRSKTMTDVDSELRHQLLLAFQNYQETIPDCKKETSCSFKVKDIVARASPGIGSAGKTSYNILVQGKTQALESDVVIFMKPATKSAVATVINDPNLTRFFQHDGLRTVLCAYAMHAVTSKWLGYSTLNNQIPLLVDEVATHSKDLDWTEINNFQDVCQTAEYLGRAMAKIHCISDRDSIEKEEHARHHAYSLPLGIIPKHTEHVIRQAIGNNTEAFVQDMVSFAMTYGNKVRRDHRLFFEAFRNEKFPILKAHQPETDGHGHYDSDSSGS